MFEEDMEFGHEIEVLNFMIISLKTSLFDKRF